MDLKLVMLIVLAILVLGSLVVAYLSSKTWTGGQVVLVFFIFLFAGFFTFLSASALKIHATYLKKVNSLENKLTRTTAKNKVLEYGEDVVDEEDTKSQGIRSLRHELHKLTLDRGRVWREIETHQSDRDGTVMMSVAQPEPHGIKVGSILYAFEEGPLEDGCNYLGEFKVRKAQEGEASVTMAPVMDMTQRHLDRLVNSQKKWSLYEVMPVDRPALFQELDENQLRASIPPESVEEYIKDGKPAGDDDPDERVIGEKEDGRWASLDVFREEGALDQVVERRYARQLRDYQYLFQELGRQRAVDSDSIAQQLRDGSQLKDALARAKQDVTYRENEKVSLTTDLQRFEFERDLVAHYLKAIVEQNTNLQSRLTDILVKNRRLGHELTNIQSAAAREIDQRTGAVAVPAENLNGILE